MNVNVATKIFAALGFTLFCCLPVQSQAQDDVEIDVDAVARDLEAFGTRMETLRSAIDESRFDPDAMVDRLDYDAASLIGFVSADIVFQPYEGALRGAAGTLRARAGNSLDQSVLLAYLLKSAGYDARIASGELERADALRLLHETRTADVPTSLDYLEETVNEVLPGASGSVGHKHWSDTALYREARRQEHRLRKALADGGVRLAASDAVDHWLPVARRYYWVQYRDGPSDSWHDTHPAFGTTAAPGGVTADAYMVDSVPAKFHHTLTISGWIEQWRNGSIEKQRIMDDWTRPTASLNGVPLRYRNVPDGLNLQTAGHVDEAVARSSMLIPMFNGSLAPGARVFDLKGQTVDPFALSMGGAAGVFQTLSDKLGAALGEVAAREDGQPALALHSMYLEFTYTAPSGRTETRRRYLLAPREDYRGSPTELLWPLMTYHSYMVATGGEPVDFVAERFLTTGIESLALLEATVRKAFEPDVKIPLPEDLPGDAPPIAQFWLMDRRPVLDATTVSYRATPGLLGVRNGYRDATTAFAAVDVVFNRVEHLRVTNTDIQNLPNEALASGVWDTVLESVPGRALNEQPIAQSSTSRVFDLAAAQGIDTTVLMPGAANALETLSLDSTAKHFVREDLDSGYAIVIPIRVPKEARMSGWWRVNPATGETLGMTGDGYGSEVTEYLMDMVGTAKGLVDGLNSIIACDQMPNNVAKMCCLVEANINNVAGLGFGSLMGSTLGTTTATVFDIMNTAASETTGQGLMPSANLSCEKMQATEW